MYYHFYCVYMIFLYMIFACVHCDSDMATGYQAGPYDLDDDEHLGEQGLKCTCTGTTSLVDFYGISMDLLCHLDFVDFVDLLGQLITILVLHFFAKIHPLGRAGKSCTFDVGTSMHFYVLIVACLRL